MRNLYFLLVLSLLFSCKNDQAATEDFEVTIRLDRDPGQVNPFYATTSIGREVYQYVFTPLADFHPEDLELHPILVERIEEGRDTQINGQSFVSYTIDFKDDAEWSDGRPVTAQDYLFTVQMIKHPLSEISAWKPYFEALRHLSIDPSDSTRVTVYFDPDYMLSKEVAYTSYIMPSHVHDPGGILSDASRPLIDANYVARDSSEIRLVEQVNTTVNDKTEIIQCGPYTLSDYQTDEYIILTAKQDYWGEAYPDNVFLKQGPRQIIFRVVPDEVTAINMAKEGKLDFIKFRSSTRFLELKQDSAFADNWNFYTPQVMLYYFLAMNNKNGLLANREIRKAMSYLADVDDYIENIDGGLGSRTIGHFNPSKPYYNRELSPVPYDPEKAVAILNENGWTDSNGDGTLDKVVDGKRTELELNFFITGSELSQKIALLYQEAAEKAGVKINIITKSMSLLRKENLATYDFDFAALARGTDAAPDDPYPSWHSDNAVPGGGNETGYSSPEADAYISQIRSSRSSEDRRMAYHRLQEIMYSDQPAIFLYAPLQKIVIHKRIAASTTAKRPGYLANTFGISKSSS